MADLGEDGEAELLRLGAAREEDSGGAVRDLSGGEQLRQRQVERLDGEQGRRTCDALPAWVLPVLENTGLSLERLSLVTPPRMPSSSVTVSSRSSSVFGSTHLVLTGTISALNLPAFWAASARWNDWAAKASCASRETLYSVATFSPDRGRATCQSGLHGRLGSSRRERINALVMPMGRRQSAAAWHSRTSSDICANARAGQSELVRVGSAKEGRTFSGMAPAP